MPTNSLPHTLEAHWKESLSLTFPSVSILPTSSINSSPRTQLGMLHPLSDIGHLVPESRQLWEDNGSIVPTDPEPRDEAVTSTLRLLVRDYPPVIRIPPEILAYIFELYMASSANLTPSGVTSQAQGLICLAQVCKRWRTVTELNPRLWTSVHFYFPESHTKRKYDVPRLKLLIDNHLNRSGALPISLTFIDHRIYDSTTKSLVSFLVDRLREHARRWRSISFHMSSVYFPLLFEFTACDLFSLERLHISGDIAPLRHMFNAFIPHRLNLESATNLKSFTFSGSGGPLQDVELYWKNLSEVSFAFTLHIGYSYTLLLQLRNLVHCQNITSCSLGIENDDDQILEGSQTITLPRLQTLRVRRCASGVNASGVIDPLILPQLHSLEIDASHLVIRNHSWHDRTFSDLLARSGCTLHRLSIQDVDFPNDELLRCLALSPSLTSFRFIPCPRSQDIHDLVQTLDLSRTLISPQTGSQRSIEGRGPPVPKLNEIVLGSSVKEHLNSMMAMFRSRVGTRARIAGVAPLRHAEVVCFDLWHDRDVGQLRVPGDLLGGPGFASFRENLSEWISEVRNENEHGNGTGEGLKVLMMIDSPYLPEYI